MTAIYTVESSGKHYTSRKIKGSPVWLVNEIIKDDDSPAGHWQVGEPQYVTATDAESAVIQAAEFSKPRLPIEAGIDQWPLV